MKILMVNKFLYPNGGSETYMFQLGEYLQKQKHEVQYFGMEHPDRCVGNHVNAYTSNMDFHNESILSELTYPLKTIYSMETRKKIRLVLDDFKPDVIHLNNFNYQLTPSILLEIKAWSRQVRHPVRIIYTAHDYQLICPNHMLYVPQKGKICEECLKGDFSSCFRQKCIHGSTAKSMVGMMEGVYWKARGTYRYLDSIVCPSLFLKQKLDTSLVLRHKTIVLPNFAFPIDKKETLKRDYVLYFGRYAKEKGILTLLEACRRLPNIPFIFAGNGPLENEVNRVSNIKNAGFLKGEALYRTIREARLSVYPSEWYENCPYSVMESQMYGTPVLGADIGGIPELIESGKTGELFESGDAVALAGLIQKLWADKPLLNLYSGHAKEKHFASSEEYLEVLLKIYRGTENEKGPKCDSGRFQGS